MSKHTVFRILLVGVLLSVSMGWVASAWDVRRLENELRVFAEERETYYREVDQVINGSDSGLDIISVVTVTREFGLFGSPTGKITIYHRSDRPIGHSHPTDESDTEQKEGQPAEAEKFFSGIQYFYEKVEGEWLNTESGQCTAEECQTDGRKAFERAET